MSNCHQCPIDDPKVESRKIFKRACGDSLVFKCDNELDACCATS